jgi:transcriptional regulator with XRE-family HTH domain
MDELHGWNSFHADLQNRITKQAGLTWETLARRVGMPQSTLRYQMPKKNARNLVTADLLERVLQKADVPRDEIRDWLRRRGQLQLDQFGADQRPTAQRWWTHPSPTSVAVGLAGLLVGFVAGLPIGRALRNPPPGR